MTDAPADAAAWSRVALSVIRTPYPWSLVTLLTRYGDALGAQERDAVVGLLGERLRPEHVAVLREITDSDFNGDALAGVVRAAGARGPGARPAGRCA